MFDRYVLGVQSYRTSGGVTGFLYGVYTKFLEISSIFLQTVQIVSRNLSKVSCKCIQGIMQMYPRYHANVSTYSFGINFHLGAFLKGERLSKSNLPFRDPWLGVCTFVVFRRILKSTLKERPQGHTKLEAKSPVTTSATSAKLFCQNISG